MSTQRDLGMGVIAKVAAAPTAPIPVKPGQTVQARMSFTNGGVLPIVVTMRLDIKHENVLTPLEGNEQSSAEVAVGAAGTVSCTYVIPNSWGAGNIQARIKAKVPGGALQDIENLIASVTTVWYIPAPSTAWITAVVITYTAL